MSKTRLAAVALATSLALVACRGAETPMVTHWYGTGSYTTGVYDTPESYHSPTN